MGGVGCGTGEIIEVIAERAIAGGRCLARRDGKVVLVLGALPGERVRARVTLDATRHAEAEIVEVLDPHPERRPPPCTHAAECGGCDYQHALRGVQLEMKRQIVVDAFRRIGRLDVGSMLEGPLPVGQEFHYRNRLRLAYDDDGRPGMLRRASHEVVPLEDCLLMPPEFGRSTLPWLGRLGGVARAWVKIGSDGATIVALDTLDPNDPAGRQLVLDSARSHPRPSSVAGLLVDGAAVDGRAELRYAIGGAELIADPLSFFQVNGAGAEELVGTVNRLIGDDRAGTLLDLFAGVGLFAVCAAAGFDRVVASDADRRSVRLLRRNLKRNRIRGVARTEPAETTLRTVPTAADETVIVDPPREGLSRQARRALIERGSRRIVSVSCDPATGARDAHELCRAGWELSRLVAVDMFPVTAHVETVALLQR